MNDAIKRIFTWWNGGTLISRLAITRNGVKVGEDELGNVYYRSRKGDRRWVLFAGEAEASSVSADWHGWMHHTYDEPPTEAPLPSQSWELPHAPNMTGTDQAYRPPGSALTPQDRPRVSGDYEAWAPK